MEEKKWDQLVKQAADGDQEALEEVLCGIQDMVFNLSLRMLGMAADAEDASQDILIKIMTHLSEFRGESSFFTWVYRLTVNHLLNYKKSMFARQPLSFEFYGEDIKNGCTDTTWEAVSEEEEERLAEELKYSCTNVMLQCLNPMDRCIFILGTMFKADSSMAGEILNLTPENYRQRLSRIRKKVGSFLAQYCGLTDTGLCCCKKRINYALSQNRISREKYQYSALKQLERTALAGVKAEMERLDELSLVFEDLPCYETPVKAKEFLKNLLESHSFETIKGR